jgi:hypothetical protein
MVVWREQIDDGRDAVWVVGEGRRLASDRHVPYRACLSSPRLCLTLTSVKKMGFVSFFRHIRGIVAG